MLLLTEDGSIIAARDRWGRTPVVIGRKDGAYAATSESSSFPNLDYEIERYLGPGEIVRMYDDHVDQLRKPNEDMQIVQVFAGSSLLLGLIGIGLWCLGNGGGC